MEKPTAYAIVGLGGRSRIYLEAISKTYSATSRLVALCDSNAGRLKLAADLPFVAALAPRLYSDSDFERMIAETKPDTVIVTCQDSCHDTYICRAMELGCDVITEKPMTIDAERAQRILDTQKRTGRKVRVTFNYRYSPPRTQVKDLLMSGAIGDILSVDFQWMLDTYHGADYFRRWHRNKANSGGLLADRRGARHLILRYVFGMRTFQPKIAVQERRRTDRSAETRPPARRLNFPMKSQNHEISPEE